MKEDIAQFVSSFTLLREADGNKFLSQNRKLFKAIDLSCLLALVRKLLNVYT